MSTSAANMKTIASMSSKSLRALLEGMHAAASDEILDLSVSDITLDSRDVKPGAMFIALPGLRAHGLMFAQQAMANGARVIAYEPRTQVALPSINKDVALVAVPELSRWVGEIADRFFDAPSASLTIVGVTGTNGKTTSAFLLPQAFAALGRTAGYAGTLGYGHVDALRHSAHTTADCITVHRQLASMRDAGDRFVGMEVSSHALDQGRIDRVRVHSALFTNLTRDHLDYHGTMEAYGAAKERLFNRDGLKQSVINADDGFGREMIERLMRIESRAPVTAYGRTHTAGLSSDRHLFGTRIELGANGIQLDFDGSWGAGRIRTRLIGAFNVENILGVFAVLLGMDIPVAQAIAALEQCHAPPGRMETFAALDRPLVVVDYAHTPDALAKALQTARAHSKGKLVCVFGCGGDRDAGKRPLMGALAEQHADIVVLTDDNPRMEDGDAIIADILQGFDKPDAVLIQRDRARAIAQAIRTSSPEDLVLIAGKGHEDYQIVGRNVKRFSDREEALKCMRSGA